MAISFNPLGILSGFDLTKLNQNFQSIKTSLSDGLSRSGGSPNQMEADIDLNSNDLLNVNIVDTAELRIGGEVVVPTEVANISPYVVGDVESVADLNSKRIPAVISTVSVAGYESSGDGGYHRRRRVSTPSPVQAWHTQSADGAWWEVIREVDVYAKAFGVKADGVVDDRIPAQNAIDFCNATGGGTVRLPAGILLLSQTSGVCLTYYSNTIVRGAGKGVTILKRQANQLGHVFNSAIGSSFCIISDLTIDGNKTAEVQGSVAGFHGIRAAGISFLIVERVHVKDCIYYGLGLQGITNFEFDVRIEDSEFENNGGWSTSGTTFGDGVDIKSANRVWITNSRSFNNAQKGFDARCTYLEITDCHASGNGDTGYHIRGRGDLSPEVRLVASIKGGSATSNLGNGITASSDDETLSGYLSISGFKSLSNTFYGILLNDALIDGEISLSHSIGNGIAGIRSVAQSVIVNGCHLLNNATYGFDNAAQNNRNIVTSNIALNNTTANIRAVGGAAAIHANNIVT